MVSIARTHRTRMQLMCQEQNFLPKGSADTFELKFGFAAGSVIRVPDLSPRCVVRSSHRLILPAAGFNGAAAIQPRGQRFKPSIGSRMSTDRSFELTVSTRCRRSFYGIQCLLCSE